MANGGIDKGRDSPRTLKHAIRSARRAREEFEPFWKRYQREIKGRQRRRSRGGPMRLTNYPYLYERSFLPQLAGRIPEFHVKPDFGYSDALIAEIEQLALERVAERQEFDEELRLCVQDGLYAFMFRTVGMFAAGPDDTRVGGADPGSFHGDPMWLDGTMVFFERISPWDALWDDSATSPRACSYMGREFTRELSAVTEDDRYDQAARRLAENRVSTMRDRTREQFRAFDEDEIPPLCNLIELYVQPTRMLYTILEIAENDFVILRKTPFYGPPRGPYEMRAFHTCDEAPGMAPAAAWWDAYEQRELNEQRANEDAQAEHRVVTTEEENADAAAKFKNAKPNDLVAGVKNIKEVMTGGVTEPRMRWLSTRDAALERISGVSSIRLGISQPGRTASADVIADRNAGGISRDMRRSVARFVQNALDDMRWYIHNEPSFTMHTTVRGPEGLPAEVRIQGGPRVDPLTGEPLPDQRPAEAFRVIVDPDTLYEQDDALEQAKAKADAQFVLGTVRPALMSQGADINVLAYIRHLEKRANLRGITENIIPLSPMALALSQMAGRGAPTSQAVGDAARTADPVQSQVMNSPETNHAISEAATFASPQRIANTFPGANNAETSMFAA